MNLGSEGCLKKMKKQCEVCKNSLRDKNEQIYTKINIKKGIKNTTNPDRIVCTFGHLCFRRRNVNEQKKS